MGIALGAIHRFISDLRFRQWRHSSAVDMKGSLFQNPRSGRKVVSAIAETSVEVPADDRLARRNALVLAVAQALSGANNTVVASTGGILGVMLAPDKALATLPISAMVIGMWLGTLPVG